MCICGCVYVCICVYVHAYAYVYVHFSTLPDVLGVFVVHHFFLDVQLENGSILGKFFLLQLERNGLFFCNGQNISITTPKWWRFGVIV